MAGTTKTDTNQNLEIAELKGQVDRLTELLTAALGGVIVDPKAPNLDKNQTLHATDMYPILKELAHEETVVVTCVAPRGVSTGVGQYLQPGETSAPIPATIAAGLVKSGACVEGDKAPKDLADRLAAHAAEELRAVGGAAVDVTVKA